jgi:hypothetical protein
MLTGCLQPSARDQARDEAAMKGTVLLQPPARRPVDAGQAADDDPAPPQLSQDVWRLSSDQPLEPIQANNRLRAAGERGVLAVAVFIANPAEEEKALAEAVRFLEDIELKDFEPKTLETVRDTLADLLKHSSPMVRERAARALQIHGPGARRTEFVQSIADTDREVRWAVVRRYKDNPVELQRAQREILIGFLSVRPVQEFAGYDVNADEVLSRGEYPGSDGAFASLDKDGDGGITAQEWTEGSPSAVRADVCALLSWLHSKRTPGETPIRYNPYASALEQQDAVSKWNEWSSRLQD